MIRKINDFITAQTWTFAKSMAKIPHEYIVRERIKDDESFNALILYIRSNGVKERFFSKEFVYWYNGEYKYWTMGAPVDETTIINRARVDNVQ